MTRVTDIWKKYQGTIMGHRVVLEHAVAALFGEGMSENLRRSADREADQMATLVGAHGFTTAARLAREMSNILGAGAQVCRAQSSRLVELVTSLRRELERLPALQERLERSSVLQILIVDHNAALAEALALEAMRMGITAEVAFDLTSAENLIFALNPKVVLLDLYYPEGTANSLGLIQRLAQRPNPVATFAISATDNQADRLLVAQAGGAGFIRKQLQPGQIIQTIQTLSRALQPIRGRGLLLSGDGEAERRLAAALGPHHIELKTVSEAPRIWEMLSSECPDLVWLDQDRFPLSATDLCRMIRNEARWALLPIIVLASNASAGAVETLLAAGADLVAQREASEATLGAQAEAILRRVRTYRLEGPLDPATGAYTREASLTLLEQLRRLAQRQNEPWCIVVVSLDQIDSIRDHDGPWLAEGALQRLAHALHRTFRSEDVIARWDNEQFVVGLFGIDRDQAQARMNHLLKQVSRSAFPEPAWAHMRVTLSAGVAQYPTDGDEVEELYSAAAKAWKVARQAGGNCVLRPHEDPVTRNVLDRVDLVLVDDDPEADAMILNALQRQRLSARWIRNGQEALKNLSGAQRSLATSLVLLDTQLPDMNGLDLLRQLRREVLVRDVIVLSRQSSEAEVAGALELGAFDYVTKPISAEALIQRIQRSLEAPFL